MSEKKLPSRFHVDHPKALDKFLTEMLSVSRKEAKRLLDSRMVYVNNTRVWIAGYNLKRGDIVSVYKKQNESITLTKADILFDDQYYVVINKPSGMVSNGSQSVELLLQKFFKDKNILAVHRLDKDTTGCLIFARGKESWDKIVDQFDEVDKKYKALVPGRFPHKTIKVTVPIDGKSAESIFIFDSFKDGVSTLSIVLKTGRTHQIRKHLLHLNFPILGDKVYTSKKGAKDEHKHINRQMLHAEKIKFIHPFTKKLISLTAPIPKDMKVLTS